MYTRGDDDDDDDDEFRVSLGEVSSPTWPSRLFPGTEPRKRPPEQRSPPPPQIRPPGLEPDPSGPSRASLSHRIPAGALLPRGLLGGPGETDSVAVHPVTLLSPLCRAPRRSRG